MSSYNKVIWSEGLFLQPQHFQQLDRYFEGLVERRVRGLTPFGWGFRSLVLDQNLLRQGKFSVISAEGVLPDGTPFLIPEMDAAPEPITIPEGDRDELVYLAVPSKRPGFIDVDVENPANPLVRYQIEEAVTSDSSHENAESVTLQVGKLNFSLRRASQERSGYSCLPVARVVECRNDEGIVLHSEYVPPSLKMDVHPRLSGFLEELLGLLRNRGEHLAARLGGSTQGAVAEVSDLLLLQLINRSVPVLQHFREVPDFHPERFYSYAIQLAGEVGTFTTVDKRPPQLAPYNHDDVSLSFQMVMDKLRESLTRLLVPTAISLPVEERPFGVRVSPISDRSLVKTAIFVLAVKAELSSDQVRRRVPAQVKVGPVEHIKQLVNSALPGISLEPLSVVPRQIPYDGGFTYFQLTRGSHLWQEMNQSAAFAIHIGGEFPKISLDLWAIRGNE